MKISTMASAASSQSVAACSSRKPESASAPPPAGCSTTASHGAGRHFSAARTTRRPSRPAPPRFANSACPVYPANRRHGTARNSLRTSARRLQYHPGARDTDSPAPVPPPERALSSPDSPRRRSTPPLPRTTMPPQSESAAWLPHLAPMESAEELLKFILHANPVQHAHAVPVQTESRREREPRPSWSVIGHRRRDVMRRVPQAEAVRRSQPAIDLRARRKTLPAQNACMRSGPQRQRTARPQRVPELPRIPAHHVFLADEVLAEVD